MAVEYVGKGEDDGIVLGRSATDKVGFYNATPVAQQATTLAGALTAGETTASDVAAAVVDLYDALEALGLVVAS